MSHSAVASKGFLQHDFEHPFRQVLVMPHNKTKRNKRIVCAGSRQYWILLFSLKVTSFSPQCRHCAHGLAQLWLNNCSPTCLSSKKRAKYTCINPFVNERIEPTSFPTIRLCQTFEHCHQTPRTIFPRNLNLAGLAPEIERLRTPVLTTEFLEGPFYPRATRQVGNH